MYKNIDLDSEFLTSLDVKINAENTFLLPE